MPGPRRRFEVAAGAVLTQNTAWGNAEAALARCGPPRLLIPGRPPGLPSAAPGRLDPAQRLLQPEGPQAARSGRLSGRASPRAGCPTREALLALWGIGPETADSILLYAWHVPVPVVDAYTRRLFHAPGLDPGSGPATRSWPPCARRGLPAQAPVLQEFHALVVRHAKEHCRASPRLPRLPAGRQALPLAAARERRLPGR